MSDDIETQPGLFAQEAPPAELMPPASKHGHHVAGRIAATSMFNRAVASMLPLIPKSLIKPMASRYVAGETLDDMLSQVTLLNDNGFCSAINVLGEFIETPEQAQEMAETYKTILLKIQEHDLDANISIKLSGLGLLLDTSLCEDLMRDLLSYASEYNNFIRVEMEDSSCTDDTIDMYLRLRESFNNVGIVLQACMRRTHADAKHIIAQDGGHFRLCKGIYIEPRWLAYQDPQLINQNYGKVLEEMFHGDAYVGIATHDERIVWDALRLIDEYDLTSDQYEFQMLMGVDTELRDMLHAAGHKVRVYVPFGPHWHAYCIRRFKENPKIIGHVMSNLFKS